MIFISLKQTKSNIYKDSSLINPQDQMEYTPEYLKNWLLLLRNRCACYFKHHSTKDLSLATGGLETYPHTQEGP